MSESEPDIEPEEEAEEIEVPEDIEVAEADLDDVPGAEQVQDQQQRDVLSYLSQGGIKQALLAENYQDPETGHTYSQADLIADVINVMRMDAKQMAKLHGVDVKAEKMSPEKAASLIQRMATGEDMAALIRVFQGIEEMMDPVFQQELNEENYQRYQMFKENMLYTNPDGE